MENNQPDISVEEATQRMRQLEKDIQVLSWDLKMNQIHPAKLHDLRELEAEMKNLTEQFQEAN